MNDIIKNIEAAQLKAEVPAFNVGDTVRVSAKVKEHRYLKVLLSNVRMAATVKHLQLERVLMV